MGEPGIERELDSKPSRHGPALGGAFVFSGWINHNQPNIQMSGVGAGRPRVDQIASGSSSAGC